MICSRFSIILIAVFLVLSCSSQNAESQQKSNPESPTPAFLNDSTLLLDKQYQTNVYRFIRTETLALLASDTSLKNVDNQWNLARLRITLDTFTEPAAKNFWLDVIVKDQIENYGIKNADAIMKLFYKNSTDSTSVREVRKLYNDEVEGRKGHTIVAYKTAGRFSLDAHIFHPENFQQGQQRPAIMLFHGGSWYQGKPEWMFESCKRYASLGMVAMAIEYRLYDRHGVTPLECISDAKSAIRWARQNAGQLGIDPNKIVASGFSAGGHLVACAATLDILDEPHENTSISAAPNAMVFLSSCFDPTLDPWFVKQVERRFPPKNCSPNHNIQPRLPPSLVFHGTDDKMCPFWTAEKFWREMTDAGNRAELHRVQGAGHFFIFDQRYREEAEKAVERFLSSLGFLPSR